MRADSGCQQSVSAPPWPGIDVQHRLIVMAGLLWSIRRRPVLLLLGNILERVELGLLVACEMGKMAGRILGGFNSAEVGHDEDGDEQRRRPKETASSGYRRIIVVVTRWKKEVTS